MNQQTLLDALSRRIARLEATRPQLQVLNQQEAARFLGMGITKFRAEQKAGRIRGALSGRLWMFKLSELERYAAGEPITADAA